MYFKLHLKKKQNLELKFLAVSMVLTTAQDLHSEGQHCWRGDCHVLKSQDKAAEAVC